MDKEVNRIKLIRLYSETNIFDEIIFKEGINIILGEKYDDRTRLGRKTNGVGKSMCIEFLDFCLLNDYKKSRISKIPLSVFPSDSTVNLELMIGEDRITIKRNRGNYGQPIIVRNEKENKFEKIEEAKNYLTELIFKKLDGNSIPTYRNLLSILMRDERSEFLDILKPHEASRSIPTDLTTPLYLLGIPLEPYNRIIEIIKDIKTINKVIAQNKKDLNITNKKKISDVKAELNSQNAELKKISDAIESFKSNEAYKSLQKEIIELEDKLQKLRIKDKSLRYEYKKIKQMPKPEEIDDDEIETVYNYFKKELGTAIVKTLRQSIEFKNKVENFQRLIINQKAQELDKEIKDLNQQISFYDYEYSKKIKIIDNKGALKNLKNSLKIYEEKKQSCSKLEFLFNQYEENNRKRLAFQSMKSNCMLELSEAINENKVNQENLNNTILNIHEKIMGNEECSFILEEVSNKERPIEISMRIFDDGSHSVNRTKVFIYDTALMFSEATRLRHPHLLVHDNIFDVDQDTLVQCLNYLEEQERLGGEFQYILTLNRDKIENEERDKVLKMNITENTIASFTKKDKFLKTDYQELK